MPEPQLAPIRRTSPVFSTSSSAASRSGSGSAASSAAVSARPRRRAPRPGRVRAGAAPRGRTDGGSQVRRRGGAARGERPGALHREQRVAVGRTDDLFHGVVGQLRDAAGHRRDLRRRQRPELELGGLDAAPGQVGEQRVGGGAVGPVAPGQHEQHRPGRQPAADVRAQLQAGRVGSVHVLGDQEHGTPGRGPLHQPEHGVEHPQPLQLRRGHRSGRRVPSKPRGDSGASLPSSACQSACSVGRDRAGQLRHQFLPYGERRLAADVDPGADRVWLRRCRRAGPVQRPTGSSDTSLPGDQDHAAVPGARFVQAAITCAAPLRARTAGGP